MICKDYLLLLKEEKKTNLTCEEIDEFSENPGYQEKIKESIDEELLTYEVYQGQKISSERAWYIFCEIIVNEDLETGDKIWNEFLEDIFRVFEKNKKSLINSRRGGGKTFVCCVYAIFKMYLSHHFQVLCSFNIPPMIETFFDKFREIIDENEFLLTKKEPNKKNLIWGVKSCIYNKGRAKGITLRSTGRSKHPNLAIIDDIYGRPEEGERFTNEDVENFIKGDIFPLVERKKARIIFIGTVDNPDDMYHIFALDKNKKYSRTKMLCTRDTLYKSDTGWACRIYPGVLNFDTKEVFLPNTFTWEGVMEKKRDMGDFKWFREIQQECKIDTSALMSHFLFAKCYDNKRSLMEIGVSGRKYLMIIDPSAGEGKYSDYAAICVLEILRSQLIVRYIWHERLLPIIDPEGGKNDLTNKSKNVYNDFLKPELWIENNSIGRILIQSLRKEGVDPFEHNTNEDKVKIMMDAISEFKQKDRVVIPNNPECSFTQEWVPMLKKECLGYALSKKGEKLIIEGRGINDDMVTCLLLGIHYSGDESTGLAMGIVQD